MIFDALKAVVTAIVLMAILIQPVCGQQASVPENRISYVELVEQSFGPNQNLINGTQYFDHCVGCKGIPYFTGTDFVEGELTIKNRVYHDQRIRYDIFSQSVEVEYDNLYGRSGWLVAVTDYVEAFKIGEYPFMKLNLDGLSGKFYQVIRTEWFTCYVHWEKQLLPLHNDLNFIHEFSKPKSTCLLDVNGEISALKNRKDLVELFPDHQKKKINRLLKKKLVRVQKASPGDMVWNMNVVANFLKTGGDQ